MRACSLATPLFSQSFITIKLINSSYIKIFVLKIIQSPGVWQTGPNGICGINMMAAIASAKIFDPNANDQILATLFDAAETGFFDAQDTFKKNS